MKGLLYKDGLTLMRAYRLYLLIFLFFLILGTYRPGNTFWAAYSVFFLSTIISSLFTLDEQTRWLSYSDILPVSRKTIVSERYLLNAGLTLAMIAAFVILSLIFRNLDGVEILSAACLMLSLSFVTSSISIPLNIKFGSAKGQVARLVTILIMVSGCMIVLNMFEDILDIVRSFSPVMLAGGLAAAVIAAYFASWRISIRIFENKDL